LGRRRQLDGRRGYYRLLDNISHSKLMKLVEERICDRRILKLIKQWLEAGVMKDGIWHKLPKLTNGYVSTITTGCRYHRQPVQLTVSNTAQIEDKSHLYKRTYVRYYFFMVIITMYDVCFSMHGGIIIEFFLKG
jgi:hypothetical protein